MNRIKTRVRALAAEIAAVSVVAATLSGCGAGQISQTANQEPAVNGTRLTIGNVALRDIRIQAVQTGDFLKPGKAVNLALVVVNQSPDLPDRLVGISSDVGTVALSGDAQLPSGGTLFVGTSNRQNAVTGSHQSNGAARATVTLTKPITNGLTYEFTFSFEKAGQGTVTVPISADLAPQPEPAKHS